MKNSCLILTCFMLFSLESFSETQRYSELSEGDQTYADDQLRRLRNINGPYTYTDEELLLIPEVVRNFINSSDCAMGGVREASFPGLYDWTRNQGEIVDTTRLRCEAGENYGTMKLCTANVVECTNELIGTIQRQNVTYVVPAEEACRGDAKQAMLNAMRIGNMSVGVQGIAPEIRVW